LAAVPLGHPYELEQKGFGYYMVILRSWYIFDGFCDPWIEHVVLLIADTLLFARPGLCSTRAISMKTGVLQTSLNAKKSLVPWEDLQRTLNLFL